LLRQSVDDGFNGGAGNRLCTEATAEDAEQALACGFVRGAADALHQVNNLRMLDPLLFLE
jgi:hypothetical protein